MNVIIFLCIILVILIIYAINCYVTVIRPFKEEVSNLKVGDTYLYTIEDENPFIKSEILECTIIDIQYWADKIPYVKYEFTDGSINTMRFDRFIQEFEKVD